ncbi:hypothetical protein QZH41_010095, partial [Actinostola sp. cb2023]
MAKILNCFGNGQKNNQNTPQKERFKTSRVLLGDLRHCETRSRRLFELALPSSASKCGEFFPPFDTEAAKLAKLHQTFPQWKIQKDFQKLHYRQRKRIRQKRIYMLPIGPFPDFVSAKIPCLKSSLFELLCKFVSNFYLGFEVELLDVVNVNEIQCKTRIHGGTGTRQILVADVLSFLRQSLPKDAFSIVGITWEDLYPSDDWNFVLGEASSVDGCAAMSFGHYEPADSQKMYSSGNKNCPENCMKSSRKGCDDFNFKNGKEFNSNSRHQDDAEDKVDGPKVISHELGHVFGITHCVYFACAMNESSSVLEAVNQPLFLCPVCLRKVQRAAGFDVTERYLKLRDFLEMVYAGLLEATDK